MPRLRVLVVAYRVTVRYVVPPDAAVLALSAPFASGDAFHDAIVRTAEAVASAGS